MQTPKELAARFSYQFSGTNIGLVVSRGWFSQFFKLCEEIDTVLGDDKRDFHWTQLKVKFGAPRWYWSLPSTHTEDGPLTIQRMPEITGLAASFQLIQHTADPEREQLVERIRALVNDAEARAHETCIYCAEPGSVDDRSSYYIVVCPKHLAQRRGGLKLDFRFSEAEDFQPASQALKDYINQRRA